VRLTVTLVRSASREPLYFVSVAERIDARKRIEAALAAREAELRSMEAREALAQARRQVNSLQVQLIHTSRLSAMGTMASSLAHELNQPLAAVVNYMSGARRLLEQEAPGGRHSAIAAILAAERSAIHAGDVIRRIRTMLTRREMKKEGCVLATLIEEAAAIALVGPEARGVFYLQDVAADLSVMADPLQIQQVLINLIRNGLDAFSAGGDNIRISAVRQNLMVRISVSDNGPGLSEQVRSTLFEPFLSTKADGMGVGLSICRTIVEAHGGKIWFAPNAGDGATVCFTLPAA
jgi:two-component system sensor kinase FixL